MKTQWHKVTDDEADEGDGEDNEKRYKNKILLQ